MEMREWVAVIARQLGEEVEEEAMGDPKPPVIADELAVIAARARANGPGKCRECGIDGLALIDALRVLRGNLAEALSALEAAYARERKP